MTPAISVSEMAKKYGEVDAVRGIDFDVASGETFGFLGPNGAGRSTTIKILCTLADRHPASATGTQSRRHVGRLASSARPIPGMVTAMGLAVLAIAIAIAQFRKTE